MKKVLFVGLLMAFGGTVVQAQILDCPQMGRIILAGEDGSIAYGNGVPGYNGTAPLYRSTDFHGYVDYQTGNRDNVLVPHELMEGKVKSAGVIYLIPDEAQYSDTCTLESPNVIWNLDCTAPGQKINGAQYTEVSGTIGLDLTAREVSIDVVETSLPPFTPQVRHFGGLNLPITVKTERVDKANGEVLRWELRLDGAVTGAESENYYTVDFPVLAAGGGFPPGDVLVSVTHTITSDVGERAPDQQTSNSGYDLRCLLRP